MTCGPVRGRWVFKAWFLYGGKPSVNLVRARCAWLSGSARFASGRRTARERERRLEAREKRLERGGGTRSGEAGGAER